MWQNTLEIRNAADIKCVSAGPSCSWEPGTFIDFSGTFCMRIFLCRVGQIWVLLHTRLSLLRIKVNYKQPKSQMFAQPGS